MSPRDDASSPGSSFPLLAPPSSYRPNFLIQIYLSCSSLVLDAGSNFQHHYTKFRAKPPQRRPIPQPPTLSSPYADTIAPDFLRPHSSSLSILPRREKLDSSSFERTRQTVVVEFRDECLSFESSYVRVEERDVGVEGGQLIGRVNQGEGDVLLKGEKNRRSSSLEDEVRREWARRESAT